METKGKKSVKETPRVKKINKLNVVHVADSANDIEDIPSILSEDTDPVSESGIGACVTKCCYGKITFKLAHFIVLTIITFLVMIVCILNFADILLGDEQVFITLFFFVVGIWVPNPKLSDTSYHTA